MKRVISILEAAGANRAAVVRATVYLSNIDSFEEMNEVFARYFPDAPPARTTIEARLHGGAAVIVFETTYAA